MKDKADTQPEPWIDLNITKREHPDIASYDIIQQTVNTTMNILTKKINLNILKPLDPLCRKCKTERKKLNDPWGRWKSCKI